MKKKIKICNKNELKENSINLIKCNEKEILIIKSNDEIFLTSSICLHMGAPLVNGKLTKEYLQCPWHGCKWDFKDGKCLNNSMQLKTFEHLVENDEIFLLD